MTTELVTQGEVRTRTARRPLTEGIAATVAGYLLVCAGMWDIIDRMWFWSPCATALPDSEVCYDTSSVGVSELVYLAWFACILAVCTLLFMRVRRFRATLALLLIVGFNPATEWGPGWGDWNVADVPPYSGVMVGMAPVLAGTIILTPDFRRDKPSPAK